MQSDTKLPSGWEAATDEEGHVFYIDHNSQTTTWIHPLAKSAAHNSRGGVRSNESSPLQFLEGGSLGSSHFIREADNLSPRGPLHPSAIHANRDGGLTRDSLSRDSCTSPANYCNTSNCRRRNSCNTSPLTGADFFLSRDSPMTTLGGDYAPYRPSPVPMRPELGSAPSRDIERPRPLIAYEDHPGHPTANPGHPVATPGQPLPPQRTNGGSPGGGGWSVSKDALKQKQVWMVQKYLLAAQDDLRTKQHLQHTIQQRLLLAQQEWLLLRVKSRFLYLDCKFRSLSQALNSQPAAASSDASPAPAAGGAGGSPNQQQQHHFSPEALTADLEAAKVRVERLRADLLANERDMNARGDTPLHQPLGLVRLQEKLPHPSSNLEAHSEDAQPSSGERSSLFNQLKQTIKEKNELIQLLYDLSYRVPQLASEMEPPAAAAARLGQGSPASGGEYTTGSSSNPYARRPDLILKIDEARRRVAQLEDELGDVERQLAPMAAESDRDRLLLIREKESLLKDLKRSLTLPATPDQQADVRAKVKALQAGIEADKMTSNRIMSERLTLEQRRRDLQADLDRSLHLLSFLEADAVTSHAASLSASTSSHSLSSRGSGLSVQDVHNAPLPPLDMAELELPRTKPRFTFEPQTRFTESQPDPPHLLYQNIPHDLQSGGGPAAAEEGENHYENLTSPTDSAEYSAMFPPAAAALAPITELPRRSECCASYSPRTGLISVTHHEESDSGVYENLSTSSAPCCSLLLDIKFTVDHHLHVRLEEMGELDMLEQIECDIDHLQFTLDLLATSPPLRPTAPPPPRPAFLAATQLSRLVSLSEVQPGDAAIIVNEFFVFRLPGDPTRRLPSEEKLLLRVCLTCQRKFTTQKLLAGAVEVDVTRALHGHVIEPQWYLLTLDTDSTNDSSSSCVVSSPEDTLLLSSPRTPRRGSHGGGGHTHSSSTSPGRKPSVPARAAAAVAPMSPPAGDEGYDERPVDCDGLQPSGVRRSATFSQTASSSTAATAAGSAYDCKLSRSESDSAAQLPSAAAAPPCGGLKRSSAERKTSRWKQRSRPIASLIKKLHPSHKNPAPPAVDLETDLAEIKMRAESEEVDRLRAITEKLRLVQSPLDGRLEGAEVERILEEAKSEIGRLQTRSRCRCSKPESSELRRNVLPPNRANHAFKGKLDHLMENCSQSTLQSQQSSSDADTLDGNTPCPL